MPDADKPRGLIILFRYNDPDYYGGIERKILIISEWLRDRGLFTPVLLTNYDTSDFVRDFRALDLPVHTVDMSGPRGLWRTARAAEDLADRYRAPLIQTHRFWTSVAAAIVRRRRPDLRHLHRIHTHIQGSTIPAWRVRLYHLLDRMIQNNVDRYCVLSGAVRDELVRHSGIDESKIRIVHNGIPELGPELPYQNDDRPLRPTVAVVGEFEERKRQGYLVRAIARIRRERGMEITASLIGGESTSYADEVRRLARDLGVDHLVDFPGYTEDVYNAIRDIEVVAMPSDFEGIPTSVIEAMSIRKLVVATNVGGTAELIDDGVNGFLVEMGEWERMADILHEIFSRPSRDWSAMREAAREKWARQFAVEAMMRGLMESYRDLGLIGEARSLTANP